MSIRKIVVASAISAAMFATPTFVVSAGPTTYEVQPGDSLSGIAARHGVSLGSLLKANDLEVSSLILPGQDLQLPPGADAPKQPSRPTPARATSSTSTHTVVWGDSLSGIASKYGVRMSALMDTNDLTITSVILPGRKLRLPAGASGVTTPSDSTKQESKRPTPTSTETKSSDSHTIVAGDSLSGIAAKYAVRLSSLLRENGLTVDSLILPGQKLRLPAGATVRAKPSESASPSGASKPSSSSSSSSSKPAKGTAESTVSHTVVWGDSLSAIAGKYGITLSALLRENGLEFTSLILPGQKLRLPAGTSVPKQPAPTAQPADPAPAAAPASASSQVATGVQAVVEYAKAQVGKPYKFFTKGPDTFDCSGLTVAAYEQVGISLIHYSAAQSLQGTAVDFRNEPIQAGDLIFQKRRGSETINHVGIAVSSTTWVQATGTGDFVRMGSLPAADDIDTVRRILTP